MDTPTRPIKAYLLEVLQVPEFVRLENARKAVRFVLLHAFNADVELGMGNHSARPRLY